MDTYTYIYISIESITLNRFSYVYIASIILREVIKIFEIFETNRESGQRKRVRLKKN